jgi:hypothetical protein
MIFPSQSDYELLVYTLPQTYPDILWSSLRFYTTSRGTAMVKGNVRFRNGLELRVNETVDFVAGRISNYSYTVFRGEERIRWYDPQPHPETPELAVPTPTTITNRPTSSATAALLLASVSPHPTCPISSPRSPN